MFIWKPIYRPGDISANRYNFFNAFILEDKSYNSFRLTVYISALFCKKQYMETINCSKNVLINGVILFSAIYKTHEFTNHPWTLATSFFYSEAKSSNMLSMPKATGSIFGLPPQTGFITWKCWYNIFWPPLLVPNTIALGKPLNNSIITCVNELIFYFYFLLKSFICWISSWLVEVSFGLKLSYFFAISFRSLLYWTVLSTSKFFPEKWHFTLYLYGESSKYSTISLVHWNFSLFSLSVSVSVLYIFFLFAWSKYV